jgi:restriction endonuclease Mrr
LHKVLQISPDDVENGENSRERKRRIDDNDIHPWSAKKLDAVREQLYQIDPTQFERLVAEVFSHLGYSEVRHLGQSNDGGVDILAKQYRKDGIHYAVIQCKRYRKKVGAPVARDLAGVLSQQSGSYTGYLVTSSDFTSQCRTFVAKSGGNIKLINGLALSRYILQYRLERML